MYSFEVEHNHSFAPPLIAVHLPSAMPTANIFLPFWQGRWMSSHSFISFFLFFFFNCRIIKLSHCRIGKLSHCRIISLANQHITALSNRHIVELSNRLIASLSNHLISKSAHYRISKLAY